MNHIDQQVYERAMTSQKHLEKTPLNELNPTGQELRSIMDVLTVGWGHGESRNHVQVVENLLKKRGIIQ